MQSQQAMNVSNPLTLLSFLESSIGTGTLQDEIRQTTIDQQKSIDRCQELKTEIQRSLKLIELRFIGGFQIGGHSAKQCSCREEVRGLYQRGTSFDAT